VAIVGYDQILGRSLRDGHGADATVREHVHDATVHLIEHPEPLLLVDGEAHRADRVSFARPSASELLSAAAPASFEANLACASPGRRQRTRAVSIG
jgi:hypothetical protein